MTKSWIVGHMLSHIPVWRIRNTQISKEQMEVYRSWWRIGFQSMLSIWRSFNSCSSSRYAGSACKHITRALGFRGSANLSPQSWQCFCSPLATTQLQCLSLFPAAWQHILTYYNILLKGVTRSWLEDVVTASTMAHLHGILQSQIPARYTVARWEHHSCPLLWPGRLLAGHQNSLSTWNH